jgi:ABC-type phosphate transport system substrate-binding protein
MSSAKSRVFGGVSALILSASLAAAAHAQTAVYGGASALSAPYLRQAEDCFGQRAPLFTAGQAAQDPTPGTYNVAFNGVPLVVDCSATPHTFGLTDPKTRMFVESAGAAANLQAFLEHSPAALGAYAATDGSTGHVLPTMHYAVSDTPLGSASLSAYNNGSPGDFTGTMGTIVAPGVTPGPGQFPNPASTYGPLVQIPLFVVPIAVAYSPVYKKVVQGDGTVKSYAFNITNAPNKGVLRLDTVTYCKIFNGQITDWNDPAIAAVNGKKISARGVIDTTQGIDGYTPIYDPTDPDVDPDNPTDWHLPIELVGNTESSGATSIFTRALAAQCDGISGLNNQFADASNTLPSWTGANPAGLTDVTATPGSGKFTTRKGSAGVAGYLRFKTSAGPAGTAATSGKIAYLTPDFVGPVDTSFGAVAAQLQNYNNFVTGAAIKTFIAPTPARAVGSYLNASVPPGADAADPSKWVQPASKLAFIARPNSPGGYPIVGTTQLLLYTCYADAAKNSDQNLGYKLNQFLKFYLKSPVVSAAATPAFGTTGGILMAKGFAAMPPGMRAAEYNEFVSTTFDTTNHLWVSGMTDVKAPLLDPATGLQKTDAKGNPLWKVVLTHNPICGGSVTGG